VRFQLSIVSITFASFAICACSGQSIGANGPSGIQPGLANAKPATSSQLLVVGNASTTSACPGSCSILTFGIPFTTTAPSPYQNIHGTNTKISTSINEVAVGPTGRIFSENNSIYPFTYKFPLNANGNATPTSIAQYALEVSASVDASGNIYEGYLSPASGAGVAVSDSTFHLTRNINGTATEILNPISVNFDGAGNLYVANWNNASSTGRYSNVVEFSPTANGDATPMIYLTGTKTKISHPTEVWIDTAASSFVGRILVSDYTGHVLVFSPGSTGNVAPVQDITNVAHPTGVTSDSDGNIYVSVPNGNAIRVFSPTATGNATPTQVISGSSTSLDSPVQLYMAPFPGSSQPRRTGGQR